MRKKGGGEGPFFLSDSWRGEESGNKSRGFGRLETELIINRLQKRGGKRGSGPICLISGRKGFREQSRVERKHNGWRKDRSKGKVTKLRE